MTVIDLSARRAEQRRTWRCNCGSLSFALHEDSSIECSNCGSTAGDVGGGWVQRLADAPAAESSAPDVVVRTGVGDLARAAIVRDAQAPDVVALGIVTSGGKLRLWTAVDGGAQRRWLRRQLAALAKMAPR